MTPIIVHHLDDPRLDVFRDLKAPRDSRFRSLFVVEGLLVTERLLASRLEVTAVVSEPRFVNRFAAQLDPSIPLYVLARESIQKLAGFNFHRGVLSCGRRPESPELSTGVRIALGRGVCGTAAERRQTVVVPDGRARRRTRPAAPVRETLR